MAYDSSAIPWTDEEWAGIEDVIQQEARSARVAASFLPLFGPLPPDADFVRSGRGSKKGPSHDHPGQDDRKARDAAGACGVAPAQIADRSYRARCSSSAARRSCSRRLEDLVVFRGLEDGTTPGRSFGAAAKHAQARGRLEDQRRAGDQRVVDRQRLAR